MNIVAVIPARYSATRFPGKLMQMLGKKPGFFPSICISLPGKRVAE